jgi:hypothetical protein
MADVRERILIATPTISGGIIAAPFQFQLQAADSLDLTYAATLPALGTITGIILDLRILTPLGDLVPTEQTIPVIQDLGPHTVRVPLRDGYLVSAGCRLGPGRIQVGQVYTLARIARGIPSAPINLLPLFQGFPGPNQLLAWPGSPLVPANQAPSFHYDDQPADPAPGAQWFHTTPFGMHEDIVAISAAYTTDATAGNRVQYLQADANAGNVAWQVAVQTAQAPSTIRRISWAQGFQAFVNGATDETLPLPLSHTMTGGRRVQSGVLVGGPTDTWQAVNLRINARLDLSQF